MAKRRVAFVVQRYGSEVNGGAEALCRALAEHMSRRWHVEVLTTCSKEYRHRFENDYPPGDEIIGGVKVTRYPLSKLRSNDRVFSQLDSKVLAREADDEEELEWLKEVGPYSEELMRRLAGVSNDFDAVFFFTYLYATTTLGLRKSRERSVLLPFAHDELPIRARTFDHLFALPSAIVASSFEELEFLRRRAGPKLSPASVIGMGMDVPAPPDPELFRHQYGVSGSFVLYAGRIQREKSCDDLFDMFLALPEALQERCPLLLIGKAAMPIPASPHIRHLGFVSDVMKLSAMRAADFVIMPSRAESLSIVLLEAWAVGTPVMVNGECDVLLGQCKRSHAGLWYEGSAEFAAVFSAMSADPSMRDQLGQQGLGFVRTHYQWSVVEERYDALVESLQP